MIHIRVKFTLPLLLVLGIALFLWLSRDPNAGSSRSAHPVPRSPKRPPRAPRRRRPPTEKPFIVHQDGAPDGDSDLTYEEALATGLTGEALREIADREAFDAAKTAYAEALADPTYRQHIEKLRSWRTRHAD
jgi:hypothetical protein